MSDGETRQARGPGSPAASPTRSLRCVFCAESPAEAQALCGELAPYKRDADAAGGASLTGTLVSWAHEKCASWASGVTRLPPAPAEVLREARRARTIECVACGTDGAAVGCFDVECKRSYHHGCAVRAGCLLAEPGDAAAGWLPRAAFTARGNCLWCCDAVDSPVPSCEQFYVPHAARADGRSYLAHAGRIFFDELVHAHAAHKDAEGGRPWRTYRPGDDVLMNFGADGAPARVLKIFEEAPGERDAAAGASSEEADERDHLRSDSQQALQLVLQWYQRPGQELLEDWPVVREDEVVWMHPDIETPGVSWDTQWASTIRHERVRVLLEYAQHTNPWPKHIREKHVYACHRKYLHDKSAPLLLADVERAKPLPTAQDDLRWAVDGLEDDEDDEYDADEQQDQSDGEEEDAAAEARRERRAENEQKVALAAAAAAKPEKKRRRRNSQGTSLCALCAAPERRKNEASSAAKWEGQLFEFSQRLFHEQCLVWSSGLDIEPGDDSKNDRPDVDDDDVQDLLIESADRQCSRCKDRVRSPTRLLNPLLLV